MSGDLDILLGTRPVGTLHDLGGDRSLFVFAKDYVDDPDRPVLSQCFRVGDGPGLRTARPTQTRLLPYFSNLLPEGALRSRLARQLGLKPERELPLLRHLGADLPGATVVRPRGEAAPAPAPVEEAPQPEPSRPHPLRFSLAGVQMKLSAQASPEGRLTLPASGIGGDWIVKIPDARFPAIAENELWAMQFAARLGMDVPDCRTVDSGDIGGYTPAPGEGAGPAFAIRRFDRTAGGGRVHMEDFAQVFAATPDEKYSKASYGGIAAVLWQEAGEPALVEFTRRLVYSALIGNGDMHLKNWSVLYPDGRHAQLAPAYDLLSTLPYLPDDTAALRIGRSRRWDSLTAAELERMPRKHRLPSAPILRTAAQTVEAFRDLWLEERLALPPVPGLAEAIERQLATVPLAGAVS